VGETYPDELIIDLFAGGGGASEAIYLATGRHPDVAVNHDKEAIALHTANHPTTVHLCDDIRQVDVAATVAQFPGRRVGLLWASPDCKDHSKAKGGKPKDKNIRGLAWEVLRWSAAIKRATGSLPRVIALENVEEFQDWGPIHTQGKRAGTVQKHRRSETFKLWKAQLKSIGFHTIEHRELVAADFGAPTTRKRLFLIARSDGGAIVWPKATHAPRAKATKQTDLFGGGEQNLLPYRAAAEIINWNLPIPSIFGRKKSLKPKTRARIAKGIKRYVIDAPNPFIVKVTHTTSSNMAASAMDPLQTITTAKGGEFAVSAPTIMPLTHHGSVDRSYSPTDALKTVTAAHRGELSIVAPTLVPRYGERPGQEPRAGSVEKPYPTVVPKARFGLASAFMEQANTGVVGHDAREPVSTIVGAGSTQRLVETAVAAAGEDSQKRRDVLAFLWEHFGQPTDDERADPLATAQGRLRVGLVVLDDVCWQIVDIGMRMLTPRELYSAQGFSPEYQIEITFAGKPLTKTAQTRMVGNSVSPPPAFALLAANLPAHLLSQRDAA
jgi:DNA (cytosine-5)-methyltransferase 1